MRNTVLVAAVFMLALTTSAARAQTDGETKILLPLVVEEPIYGAHGSAWVTRIALTNTAERAIALRGYAQYPCVILCGMSNPTPAGVTFYPHFAVYTREVHGYFLYAPPEDVPFVNVTIHVQDLSRQALTWGTEIPAVREDDALRGRTTLNDVPVDDRFRSRLRVYDFDPDRTVTKQISYRIYRVRTDLRYPYTGDQAPPADPDVLVTEGSLVFRVAGSGLGQTGHPGYVELDLDMAITPFDSERVRVELIAPNESLRYWAFISVTNNETQHVTTITP